MERTSRQLRRVCVLASGSSGNATFVRLGSTRLLVDVGLSMKALRARLDDIGESTADLAAVVLTHEHTDHVSGLPALLRAHPHIPVLATPGTLRALQLQGCDTQR